MISLSPQAVRRELLLRHVLPERGDRGFHLNQLALGVLGRLPNQSETKRRKRNG